MSHLPIYIPQLNPHYVFHWACHMNGIYLVKSTYGYFLRFPNSLHLPYSFVLDPVKKVTMFIAYLFSEIQSCIKKNFNTGRCICSICHLYLQAPFSFSDIAIKLQEVVSVHMQKYIKYLESIGRTYTDPFFLHEDFGLPNNIPQNIIYPTTIPIYVLDP